MSDINSDCVPPQRQARSFSSPPGRFMSDSLDSLGPAPYNPTSVLLDKPSTISSRSHTGLTSCIHFIMSSLKCPLSSVVSALVLWFFMTWCWGPRSPRGLCAWWQLSTQRVRRWDRRLHCPLPSACLTPTASPLQTMPSCHSNSLYPGMRKICIYQHIELWSDLTFLWTRHF